MAEKLNVCLMNDSFPPTVDGVSTCVANYADIIEKKFGHSMVCTPYYPHVIDDYPYPVIRYPSLSISKTFGYRAGIPFNTKTLDMLRSMPIDIIHAHCPIMSTFLARTLRESIHKPIILTYHTKFDVEIQKNIPGKGGQKSAGKLLVANVDACDEVWVVSHGAGENLRSLGYTGDYIVMQNGVDFRKGRANPDMINKVNDLCQIKNDEVVFLFVGRMMWYKGIRTILDGTRIAKTFGAQFKMIFVGEGEDKQAIMDYAQSLDLMNECLFMPATHDREMLRAYYSRASLFLFPSDFDTNGLVVREAAACATASVVLAGSCAAEGIADLENGMLIRDDPADLARCMVTACAKPEMTAYLGENAMNEIYLSWDDAIAIAWERYHVVVENYARGHQDRPIHKGDDFFRFMSYVCTAKKHHRPLKKQMHKSRKHKVYKLVKKSSTIYKR